MPEKRDEFIKKRVERQKKIRKRRLKILFAVILVLALLIGVTLSLTVFFKIEVVGAEGSALYTESEILSAAQISYEENLFLISEEETLKRLKPTLPYIEKLEFDRILPNTLKIKVTDAEEFYCIEENETYYSVSISGNVLKAESTVNENLFIIKGCEFSAEIGKKIQFAVDTDYALIEEIINLINKENLSLQYIDLSNRADVLLGVDNRFTVRLGANINLQEKIKQLSAIIAEIPGGETGIINLSMWSFDNKKGTFVAENQ